MRQCSSGFDWGAAVAHAQKDSRTPKPGGLSGSSRARASSGRYAYVLRETFNPFRPGLLGHETDQTRGRPQIEMHVMNRFARGIHDGETDVGLRLHSAGEKPPGIAWT